MENYTHLQEMAGEDNLQCISGAPAAKNVRFFNDILKKSLLLKYGVKLKLQKSKKMGWENRLFYTLISCKLKMLF